MWTKDDEAQFQILTERREVTMAARREAVNASLMGAIAAAVKQIEQAAPPPYPGVPAPKPRNERIGDAIVDSIIANADEILDALAPYDSGVRAAKGIEDCAATHLGEVVIVSNDVAAGTVSAANVDGALRRRVTIRLESWGRQGYWIEDGDASPKYRELPSVAEAETRCKAEGWLYQYDPSIPPWLHEGQRVISS